jgi:DNA (cytosine-5)-methyltransferase 1
MRLLSLFTGIAGMDRGLEAAGVGHTVAQVEKEEYCRRVLARHYPNVCRDIIDVRDANRSNLPEFDAVCGGFPCQDLSSAGKRAGLAGERSGLWYEYLRIVEETHPKAVFVENVASGARKWLPYVRRDLHMLGYRTRAVSVSAFDCGAPHLRQRVFVLAADPERFELRDEPGWRGRPGGQDPSVLADDGASRPSADPYGEGQLQQEGTVKPFWRWSRDSGGAWTVEPPVCGVALRVPHRMDRNRALGNCCTPQQAEVVGRLFLDLVVT